MDDHTHLLSGQWPGKSETCVWSLSVAPSLPFCHGAHAATNTTTQRRPLCVRVKGLASTPAGSRVAHSQPHSMTRVICENGCQPTSSLPLPPSLKVSAQSQKPPFWGGAMGRTVGARLDTRGRGVEGTEASTRGCRGEPSRFSQGSQDNPWSEGKTFTHTSWPVQS